MDKNEFYKFDDSNNYSKLNLNQIVATYIKNEILVGNLKSTDKLIETELSDILQISRSPIREAMRELNMQGILSFSPRKGNQIPDLAYNDIMEIFAIRIPLETQIIKIIFENYTFSSSDIDYLININEKMLQGVEHSTSSKEKIYILNSMDLSFHSFFWEKARSHRIANILESQFYQLLTAMNKDVSTLGRTEDKYNEHMEIISACKLGSLEKTVDAFKKHMDSYLSDVTKL